MSADQEKALESMTPRQAVEFLECGLERGDWGLAVLLRLERLVASARKRLDAVSP